MTVSAEEGIVPENAEISAKKVSVKAVDETVDEARDADKEVAESYTFDIKLIVDGEEFEPEGKIDVKFSFAEKKDEDLAVDVYHIDTESKELIETFSDENGTAEVTEEAAEDTEVAITTTEGVQAEEVKAEAAEITETAKTESDDDDDDDDETTYQYADEDEGAITNDLETEVTISTENGFSYYVVEFTYKALQYVLPGDSSVALADILAYLGIEGTVESAVSDAPELFDVVDGMVVSKKSFETTQKLTVTMVGGKVYEIVVTDPASNEAKIEDTEYATLALAYKAAKTGDTIQLLVNEIDNISGIPAGVTLQGIEGKTKVTTCAGGYNALLSGSLTDVTIKDLIFEGDGNALRYCYGYGSKIVIENCEFNCAQQYGIHFDELHADLLVKNCTIRGTVAITATDKNITFEGCTFAGRSRTSGHCNINFYSGVTFEKCKFDDVYTDGEKRGILMLGSNTDLFIMKDCTMTDDTDTDLYKVFRQDYKQCIGVINAEGDTKYTKGLFVSDIDNIETLRANANISPESYIFKVVYGDDGSGNDYYYYEVAPKWNITFRVNGVVDTSLSKVVEPTGYDKVDDKTFALIQAPSVSVGEGKTLAGWSKNDERKITPKSDEGSAVIIDPNKTDYVFGNTVYDAVIVDAKQSGGEIIGTGNIATKLSAKEISEENAEMAEELVNNGAGFAAPTGLKDAVTDAALATILNGVSGSEKTVLFSVQVDLVSCSKDAESNVSLSFEATPKAEVYTDGYVKTELIANSDLNGTSITFRLPVPSSVTEKYANVIHKEGDTVIGTYQLDIKEENGEKYVEVTVTRFSTFDMTFTNSKPVTPSYSSGGGSLTSSSAKWVEDAKGWKYMQADGSYAKEKWLEIDNPYAKEGQEKKSWFHFDKDGYMQTGWFTDTDGFKYYLNPTSDGTQGRMVHGTVVIDGMTCVFSETHDGHYGHLVEQKKAK